MKFPIVPKVQTALQSATQRQAELLDEIAATHARLKALQDEAKVVHGQINGMIDTVVDMLNLDKTKGIEFTPNYSHIYGEVCKAVNTQPEPDPKDLQPETEDYPRTAPE